MMLLFANYMALVRAYSGRILVKGLKAVGFAVVVMSLYFVYRRTVCLMEDNWDGVPLDKYRYLSQINRDGVNLSYTLRKAMKPIEQEFILNVTQYPYEGQWSAFTFPQFPFSSSKGNVELSFTKGFTKGNQFNQQSNSQLMLSMVIKDGEYIDTFFMANISFALPIDLPDIIAAASKAQEPVIIPSTPCLLSYYTGDFFESKGNKIINSTSITLTFWPQGVRFSDYSAYTLTCNAWSQASMTIEDISRGILIELSAQMNNPIDKRFRVFNICMLISIITIFQICLSVTFLLDINDNNQLGCNIDMITLSLQIFHDSLLCSAFFFLTISNEKYAANFGICALTYFVLFSVFELHILFSCWKARFNYLVYSDVVQFRKKLIQFYLLFYSILFSSMVSLSFWFNHFGLSYWLFSSTWLFQIIHSVKTSTRPPMSYEYICWFTLGKVIFPLYLKGCPGNVFELRPEYAKVYLITLLALFEGCVVLLQKLLGPKFFIPYRLRGERFSYYKDFNELIDKSNECVICLESLKHKCHIDRYLHYDEDKATQRKLLQEENGVNDCIYNFVLVIVNKYKPQCQRKDYMVTPCFHEFHSLCLEKWIECKSECPYCRRVIPSLDE